MKPIPWQTGGVELERSYHLGDNVQQGWNLSHVFVLSTNWTVFVFRDKHDPLGGPEELLNKADLKPATEMKKMAKDYRSSQIQ